MKVCQECGGNFAVCGHAPAPTKARIALDQFVKTVAWLVVRAGVLGWYASKVYQEAGVFTAFAVVSGYVFAELLWQWVRDSHELVMRATQAAEKAEKELAAIKAAW